MAHVAIYGYNEELAGLREEHGARLVKRGATVSYHSLVDPDQHSKATSALTLAKHLHLVAALYAGTAVTVEAVDAEEAVAPKVEADPVADPGLVIEMPVVEEAEAAVEVEVSAEELAEIKEAVSQSEDVVMTVADETVAAPATSSRRRK